MPPIASSPFSFARCSMSLLGDLSSVMARTVQAAGSISLGALTTTIRIIPAAVRLATSQLEEAITTPNETPDLPEVNLPLSNRTDRVLPALLLILQSWERQASPREQRSSAVERIIKFLTSPSARVLDLQELQLTSLPEIFAYPPFPTKLSALFLGYNSLEILPQSITQLNALTCLNIRFNRIKALPENLGILRNLNRLYLYQNQIAELPQSVCELHNLILLDASFNQLKELPENLGYLSQLRHLEVSGNLLTRLPSSLTLLRNLSLLNVSQNPM